MPEGRHLFANLTVLENLKLGAYPGPARLRLNESLERAYDLFPVLKTRSSQKAGSLSGGEQQMLAIARAMMSRPTILMLDEPSLGLSPILVRTMFELIATLHKQDMTILLVEQNIYQALKIADEAYVSEDGEDRHGRQGDGSSGRSGDSEGLHRGTLEETVMLELLSFELIIQLLINGVLFGTMYGIAAIGLSLDLWDYADHVPCPGEP